MSIETGQCFDPLFGEADGYDDEGYDAEGADRNGYDRDGNPVSVEASTLNLPDLWDVFDSSSRSGFLFYLRGIVRDPEDISQVVFCVRCNDPQWHDETNAARGNNSTRICEDCAQDWTACFSCDNLYPGDETTTTVSENEVCGPCVARSYSFCEPCDGWYNDDDVDDHDHEEEDTSSGCCDSPQKEFTVRNDGCEPLANDTRVTVTLPEGIISGEGLNVIRDYLWTQLRQTTARGSSLVNDLECLGDAWQARLGNYPKRLSRHAYAKYNIKISPEVLSQVGCIARDNSGSQSRYDIAVTRELNMSDSDFGNAGSCWWGGYSESRCAFKTNGGFGLRSFDWNRDVSGRAWVMPLRQVSPDSQRLVPTFNTETPDAFVVFNGYGELANYTAPRVLAHMTGWTYRKIDFEASPMYINAGGYLIAPEDIAKEFGSASLHLSLRKHADLFGTEQAAKTDAALAALASTITEQETTHVS